MKVNRRICKSVEYAVVIAVFLILSVLFVLNTSNATSPVYPTYPIYELEKADQATFTIMGKYWFVDGKLPYVDLFDHKGPVIFLLNGLGWSLTGNVYGISVIQSLFLFAYCMAAYAALKRRHTPLFAGLGVLFSLVMLRTVYAGGNTVEEFGLPFQMLGLMGLCEYARQDRAEHSLLWAFLYGISIAFFILNRATDALCICSGCVVVLVCLLRAKAYRNILLNALVGLAGIVVTILPFVVYFAMHGALNAFWYGMIGYNIEYAGGNGSFWMIGMSIKEIIEVLIYCMPIFSAFAAGLALLVQRCFRRAALHIVLASVSLYYLFTSRFYDHYVITYVPLFVAALSELDVCALAKKGRRMRILAALAAAVWMLPSAALAIRMEWNTRNDDKWHCVIEERPYDELMRAIPQQELGSTVLYNCVASIYLKYDFCPVYTYFALQDWQGAESEKLMSRIEEEIASCEAKWVMTHGGTSKNVLSVLESSYTVVMTKDNYTLYHRL